MSRIVSAGLGPAVWRAGLADPYLHWRRAKSAWELSVSWEAARNSPSGIPSVIHDVLNRHPALADPQLLIGVVEHRVVLDTPRTPSQNDLWCVLGTSSGNVSVAVEGKAGEDFDRSLAEWLGSTPTQAKRRRLAFLSDVLGIQEQPSLAFRYQLFHRAASAILEADRWRLQKALLLVQSFAESPTSWTDYTSFASLLGIAAERNTVCGPASTQIRGRCSGTDIALYMAWVDCPLATDEIAAAAV